MPHQTVVSAIERFEQETRPSLSLPSNSGWLFLINDTNSFLRQQFGLLPWGDYEMHQTTEMLAARAAEVEQLGAKFMTFVVPEKSALYKEYLPPPLDKAVDGSRPVVNLASSGILQYALEHLVRFKSFAPLYFRGDTHPNRTGAYLIYRYIHEAISKHFNIGAAVQFAELKPDMIGYDGDLYKSAGEPLINEAGRDNFERTVSLLSPGHSLEYSMRLKHVGRKSRDVDPPAYAVRLGERPFVCTEQPGSALPRCVIIRDSTSDLMVDYLCDHFSRCVAYWREGNIYTNIIEEERPDFVIHIMAERFVYTLPTSIPLRTLP
ncbi:hypothetical protein MKK68_25390 [Methylobacterium sp. E-016]|uniref:alginate O-acetyltransferase AlgX-related protein n=1 Tax=Methylobacterium sp. E-016 TaxID=2836556 RepID=UPI001FBB9524|nr:hypothetical protein [Methylobacterium sp. E-016]MCJ2078925.1 hypothetical protein [Methylobacterium sp. E-016]